MLGFPLKTRNLFLIICLILRAPLSLAQPEGFSGEFEQIFRKIEKKDFFSARDLFHAGSKALDAREQLLAGALIDNAFNQPEASNARIDKLLEEYKDQLPDSLLAVLCHARHQNAIRLFRYGEAAASLSMLLSHYSGRLSEEEADDVRNSLKLWNALKDQPPQEVIIRAEVIMQMSRDLAGLNKLEVSSGEATESFIFDTGANISTVSLSTARRFRMKMINDTIEVGTITGKPVFARLALCENLRMGQAVIRNAIFLVLDDEALSFPQVGYVIHGIIGFPVIEALGEIQISREGVFRVPMEETPFPGEQNLAMDNLQPMIRIEGRHYHFDSGADQTLLFKPYFEEFRDAIESQYELSEIRYGGAGGVQTFQGYSVPFPANIQGKNIVIENAGLIVDDIRENWSAIYGNIGQDLIRSFEKMTLNFNRMFIRFD